MDFLGLRICWAAARFFVGVGTSRLYRVKEGRMDGRRDGTKRIKGPGRLNPQAKAMPSVLQFLWRLYHSVGEGMPDKFSSKRYGVATPSVGPITSHSGQWPGSHVVSRSRAPPARGDCGWPRNA